MLGLVIGQSFNGTTLPVVLGFCVLGLVSLGLVLIVERGKLFRPQHGGERRAAQ
jgi:DHA1 family bicyclomycin/chloramphenicol resistance-like MFS transporter